MRTGQILILAIVALVVFGAMVTVLLLLLPNTTRRRLDQIDTASAAPVGESSGHGSGANWIETIAKVSHPFAGLSRPKEGWENSPLRVKFMHAGWRNPSAQIVYFGAKTILAFCLPFLLLLIAQRYVNAGQQYMLIVVLLILAALGNYIPNAVLSHQVEARQRTIFEDFPDALDLLTVCVEAGLGMSAALMRVAQEMRLKSAVLSDELELTLVEMRAGFSKEKALRNLALRTGVEDVDTLVSMLIQADRFGTSIADSLRVQADNLRTKRRLRAEEQAAKIALKLLLPLIFCIFPTLLLVLLGPAFIQIYRVLLPAFSGMQGG